MQPGAPTAAAPAPPQPPLLPLARRPSSFAIIAHRGDSASAPENTIEAFDLALDRGFPAFETDTQLSSDPIAVLIHCEELGRTARPPGGGAQAGGGGGAQPGGGAASGGGEGRRVADTPLARLRELDAGSWFSPEFAGAKVPTLDEALARYKGRAHIHLELKSRQPALPGMVAAVVTQHGWDRLAPPRASPPAPAAAAAAAASAAAGGGGAAGGEAGGEAEGGGGAGAGDGGGAAAAGGLPPPGPLGAAPGLTVMSFHLDQLARSKQLLPGVRHAWLIQEWASDLAAAARSAGAEVICPRANALSEADVRDIKSAGFLVRAWGVRTPELLIHAAACGADGATVNWPGAAAEALRRACADADAGGGGGCGAAP